MDRTTEFKSFTSSTSTVFHASGVHQQREDSEVSGISAARTGFNTDAARIGHDIHVTQLRLEELGKCM
jgi:hypothetical protein